MNATEITALSSTALRALAKEMGVKRAANDTKATLTAKVIAALPVEAPAKPVLPIATPAMENEAKVTQAKIAKAKKVCSICKTRPVSHSKDMALGNQGVDCMPCYEESGWENTHSDSGHDEINALVAEAKENDGLIELSDEDQAELAIMAGCWICHPELNEASESYVPRKGTSRAGMVMNTGHNWAPGTKADVIAAAVKEAGGTFEVKADGTYVTITARVRDNALALSWDAQGAYVYAKSVWTVAGSIKSVKVRNVAAALRLIKG